MAKKPSLIEEVLAELPRKGFAPWYERLDADLQKELSDLRRRFWSGQLADEDGRRPTKTGLADLLAKKLTSRGIHIGHSGVATWLARGKPQA